MKIFQLVAFASLASLACCSFGPWFFLGQWDSRSTADNYIIEAETTLWPGKVPDFQNGAQPSFFLWPGMRGDNYNEVDFQGGDLVQSIATAYASPGVLGQAVGQWILRSSVYTCKERPNKECSNDFGNSTNWDPDQSVVIKYVWDKATGNTTQTMLLGEKVVSELTSASGKLFYWMAVTECHGCKGILNEHYYRNTTLKLANPEPDFNNSVTYHNTSSSPIVSQDEGKTWTIDWIKMNEWNVIESS